MAKPHFPDPVLPLVGLLSSAPCSVRLRSELEALFGDCLSASPLYEFTATDHYAPEMGADLKRQFFAFAPSEADQIVRWKLATNAIEETHALAGKRTVNIDPGYLDYGGYVQPSASPRPHRIYLSGGIWVQQTLAYRAGHWEALPWTFPDFRLPTYHAFFSECRALLHSLRRKSL